MTSTLKVIGSVHACAGGFEIQLKEKYRPGLKGLSGFSHALILWLAHETQADMGNAPLICAAPYKASNEDVGVFGSRAPDRPNPICVSVALIDSLNISEGTLRIPFIDAVAGTPVLDIKPYFPASDRVDTAKVPAHFSHWPKCLEGSASFDWDAEFN